MRDLDIVKRAEGLVTDQDNFGVFYPNDGTLVSGYHDLDAARQARHDLLDLFPSAYIVRVKIERVT